MRVFGRILEERTGQQLVDNRLWRIETALRPLMQMQGLESLEALAGRLAAGRDVALANDVAEALINHESSFFRDPKAFALLNEAMVIRLRSVRMASRRLRIWSSGCSTGQEVYSLAMTFAERPDLWGDWDIDILGTDVSRVAIERAQAAVYSHFEIQRGLPVRQMLRWFEPQDESWRVIDGLRCRVRFAIQNLIDEIPWSLPFDVILCRNVLIYFSNERRAKVFHQLHGAIAPDGVLVLGAGETVMGQTATFEPDPDMRGLYRPIQAGGLVGTGSRSNAA